MQPYVSFMSSGIQSSNKSLEELEHEWSKYLVSESCPPVLGLAPLSENESDAICDLVRAVISENQRPPWRTLFSLLERFPACLAVWLSRKAGEAYEAGAFWDKFGTLIGLAIPLNQRDELARRFNWACRKTMGSWIPPKELGGRNIVAEFLYQAGLPLDRCECFAQHVRKVERSLGLPDTDDPEAGELLREAVLDSLLPTNFPTLKRALRGPAGPSICEVALNVVLKGDFKGINPLLGHELERVFESAVPGALRRSAHQPFLRLGEDLGSLEIVGPRQDSSLVGERGLTWIVDGRRHPTPRTEEFVAVVTDHSRVVLELAGLTHGNMPPRTFALRLNDLAEPFMLFDERTRKQRRVSGPIPPGTYWLLHRAEDTLVGADQTYEWPEDDRALSLFTARPGMDVRLVSEAGGSWSFAATLTPFFDPVGESLVHEGGEPVFFNWEQLPFVWLPAEETDPEQLNYWSLHVRSGNAERSWVLERTDELAGGMVKCHVTAEAFLTSLPSGMHGLELTLRRGERLRVEAQVEYWMWQGLKRRNSQEFHFAEWPQNLLREECRGFAFDELKIRHLSDQHRRHTLAFKVDDNHILFHWSQPGVFLESLERRAGQQSTPRSHRLGDAFSASINSSRWIRLWIAGHTDWDVLVAGRSWQRAIIGDSREYVELSLASLALAFPQGGDISLRLGAGQRLVARFSSPLQPAAIDKVEDDVQVGFRFEFSEPVVWARPVVRDLATGKRWSLEGQQIGNTDQCSFVSPELPQIECTRLSHPDELMVAAAHPLTLLVPKRGWTEGLWLIELETRRDEQSEWERAVLLGSDYAPIVVSNRQSDVAAITRARLFWGSYTQGVSLSEFTELDEEGRTDLFELLTELIELRQRGMVSGARKDMGWLKDAVRSLSQLAGRIARQPHGDALQIELLNLACQDAAHAGFIYLPGLLALHGNIYRELPTGYPLNDALRHCGSIAIADSVAELVRHDFAFFDMEVLGCFANFMQVAGTPAGETAIMEFQQFDHEKYWLQVLGKLRSDRLAADWSGHSILGKAHLVSALEEFVRRYVTSANDLHHGAANALLRSAPGFRAWLHERLSSRELMSNAAWNTPWPRFEAPDVDFLESAPRFASLFALAARAASAGWLEFDDAMKWLEGRVDRRWMAEQGIAVLVGLAPELFGHQLLFWELIIRTAKR